MLLNQNQKNRSIVHEMILYDVGEKMRKKLLELKNLTKYYGKIKGIEDLTLTLYEGEVFGFIGPNGAGKSTTIRIIMNSIFPTSGTVLFDGIKLDPDHIETKKMIGYLPSEIHLYGDFTVKQMLDYHASFYQQDCSKRRKELVQRFAVDETKKIEELSLGNLKKVGIVLAFMHEPKLLILDEPTSGLDPVMQQRFYELIHEEKKRGTTIFYSTHILSEISKVCDRVGLVKNGKLLKVETMEEMQKKRFTFVKISSPEREKIIEAFHLKTYQEEDGMLKFKNQFPIDQLLQILSQYHIDQLLIEEATLEEMLLEAYL